MLILKNIEGEYVTLLPELLKKSSFYNILECLGSSLMHCYWKLRMLSPNRIHLSWNVSHQKRNRCLFKVYFITFSTHNFKKVKKLSKSYWKFKRQYQYVSVNIWKLNKRMLMVLNEFFPWFPATLSLINCRIFFLFCNILMIRQFLSRNYKFSLVDEQSCCHIRFPAGIYFRRTDKQFSSFRTVIGFWSSSRFQGQWFPHYELDYCDLVLGLQNHNLFLHCPLV